MKELVLIVSPMPNSISYIVMEILIMGSLFLCHIGDIKCILIFLLIDKHTGLGFLHRLIITLIKHSLNLQLTLIPLKLPFFQTLPLHQITKEQTINGSREQIGKERAHNQRNHEDAENGQHDGRNL